MALVLARGEGYQTRTMSHDPHAQIDQNVLEMIENSPVGAVPHTPSYQDALKRLVASHQAYVSADHKGGYVSVRSLAALPSFYDEKLEAVLGGKAAAADLSSDEAVFARYVAALPVALRPKAEACRAAVVARRAHHRAKHGAEAVSDPAHSLFLVPGAGPNPGLPGNYLYGSVFQATIEADSAWGIYVHDGLDGVARCDGLNREAALDKFQEVVASSPFLLSELGALGFRAN